MTGAPCVTRWGADAPEWVCDLAGRDASTGEVVGLIGYAFVFCVIIVVGCAAGKRPPGHERPVTWREWWDSLR